MSKKKGEKRPLFVPNKIFSKLSFFSPHLHQMFKHSHLSLNAQHFLLMFRRSAAHREHDLVPRVEPDVVEEGDGEEKHHKDEPIVDDYVL